MEKRLIVAVLLSIGVLYAYSFIFPTPKPVPPGAAPKQAAVTSAATAPAGQAALSATPAGPGRGGEPVADVRLRR